MNTFDSTPRRSRRKKRAKQPASGDQGPGGRPQLPVVTSKPVLPLRPRDDLSLIEGIDPAIEMALNSIGFQKFSDFRKYSPESLSQALQERTGVDISASTIARLDWLGWAEILAAEETAVQAHANVVDEKKEAESRESVRARNEEHHDARSDENQQIVAERNDMSAKEGSAQAVEAQEVEARGAVLEAKAGTSEASLRIKHARFATFEKKTTAGAPMWRM